MTQNQRSLSSESLFRIYMPVLLLGSGLWIQGCAGTKKNEATTAGSSSVKVKDSSSSANETNKEPIKEIPASKPISSDLSDYEVNDPALASALKSGDQNRIYKEATRVLSLNAKDVDGLNSLGVYHLRNQQPLAARLQFEKSLAERETPDAYNNIGVCWLNLGKEPEAMANFRKAIQLSGNFVPALVNMGSVYAEHKSYEKALAMLQPAYDQGHRDPLFLNNFGISLVANQKIEQAKSIYRDALSKAPNNPEILLNYAILLIDFGLDKKEGLNLINRLKVMNLDSASDARVNTLEQKAKSELR